MSVSLGKNTIIFALVYYEKKKTKKRKRKKGVSNSNLFKLLLSVFRENPNKKFNYRQLSKVLKFKDAGLKIQLIDVLGEMVEGC